MSVQDDRDDTDYFLSRVTGTVVETRRKKTANGDDGVIKKNSDGGDGKSSKNRFGWTKNEESETDQLLREAPETGSLKRARRTFGILCFILFVCFTVGSVFYYIHVQPLAPIFPLGFYGGLVLGIVGILTSLWGVGTSCTRAVLPRVIYGILAIFMILCCIGGLAFGILGSTHIAHQLEGRWHHVVNTKPAEICKFESHYECSGWTENCANFTELLAEEVYWDSNKTKNATVHYLPTTPAPHHSSPSTSAPHSASSTAASQQGSGGSNKKNGGSATSGSGSGNFAAVDGEENRGLDEQFVHFDEALLFGGSGGGQSGDGSNNKHNGGGSGNSKKSSGGSHKNGGGSGNGGSGSGNTNSGGSNSNGGSGSQDKTHAPSSHHHGNTTTTTVAPTPIPTTAAPAKELRCALCMAEGYSLPAKDSGVTIHNATHSMFVNRYNTTCAHAFETKVKHRLYFILAGMGGAMVIALVCLWLAWSSRVRIVEASIPTF